MCVPIKLHISLSKTTSGKNKEINTPIDDQNYQSLSKSNAILTLPLYYLSEQKYSISLSEWTSRSKLLWKGEKLATMKHVIIDVNIGGRDKPNVPIFPDIPIEAVTWIEDSKK
jgi:hypothetical protein